MANPALAEEPFQESERRRISVQAEENEVEVEKVSKHGLSPCLCMFFCMKGRGTEGKRRAGTGEEEGDRVLRREERAEERREEREGEKEITFL